jgi:hypothetical protein
MTNRGILNATEEHLSTAQNVVRTENMGKKLKLQMWIYLLYLHPGRSLEEPYRPCPYTVRLL